ncbi:hypothetical protein V6N11_001621 [Hibiscus sabdariffa]|uniref:Uncharacterized protein n=1 Tax=Hibiscus sabdariffa TaxID=183260 RepID=A0ABR2S0U5_9ROSI
MSIQIIIWYQRRFDLVAIVDADAVAIILRSVASDNPPSIVVNLTVDRPSDVDSTVDPDVNIVYGNPSSNGVNSMIDAFVPTSNVKTCF